MSKQSKYWMAFGIIIITLIALFFLQRITNKPVLALDSFAQCIADEEAIFYGAFWCPACNAQKKLFGEAKNILPYVECSTPDRQSQLEVCVDEGITNYPTWEFKDGTREVGLLSLERLSEKTGCVIPEPESES